MIVRGGLEVRGGVFLVGCEERSVVLFILPYCILVLGVEISGIGFWDWCYFGMIGLLLVE